MSTRKNVQMNKTLYYDNKINHHLSPHQGVIPEFEEHMPPGCIMAYAASTSPTGWLICNGAAVNRYDYWSLFAVIGEQFGEGDGSTTFNIPDYRGAFLRGTGSNGVYVGPDLNASQTHATQTHNHTATSTVTDNGHTHTQTSANDDFNNTSGNDDPPNYGFQPDSEPSFAAYDSGEKNWSNINSSTTGVTVATTVSNSTTGINTGTNKTVLTDISETRPYNFGINWIIKI
jgi:microcystin-dependent protein